ncbi:MAG: 4Fe-4S cluster-binding domain-containing protein [Bacillota bacterium]|nr:4Fe-4S cluster-binding domain-containing protein [Bacillota bacterium]
MKTIVRANEQIEHIWKKGKIKNVTYRLMHYVLSFVQEDRVYLYNVVTSQMVELSIEESSMISSLPCMYNEKIKDLIEAHFLVPEDFDEHKSVQQMRVIVDRFNRKKGFEHFKILPTTSCNARCFYCYEAGCKFETMNEEMVEKVIRFIEENRMKEKTIHLNWFGGEPLLASPIISTICTRLKEKEIPYISNMISNGYFLEKLEPHWNMREIQITLDGREKVYNEVKNYVGAKENPYQKVLNNIQACLDLNIRIAIRLNISFYNEKEITSLIHELGNRFGGQKNCSAYVAAIYGDVGFNPISHSQQDYVQLFYIRRKLEALLEEYGLHTPTNTLPGLMRGQCMADNDNAIVISPSGLLGKCEHYFEEKTVGTIEEGITDLERVKYWKETKEYPKCVTCPLYPSCVSLAHCSIPGSCEDEVVEFKKKEYVNMLVKSLNSTKNDMI